MTDHIPSHLRAKCEICKEDLNVEADGVHQWTAGWVMNRSGGGGHAIACPKRENRWAHNGCVDRVRRGFVKQEQLL